MKVYFDNAATTPIDTEVFDAMVPVLTEHFGNPSSIHFHGRAARTYIEKSRKKIADLLNTSPSEIFFTSGGTEADNTILLGAVQQLGIEQIITSRIEHHAVLHTAEYLAQKFNITLSFVALDEKGQVEIGSLEALLKANKKSMVSLMHANNEIGNLLNLEEIGSLCRAYGAIFHSDTVQSLGHLKHDLASLPLDFMVGSAHKLHGPKGIGLLYIRHSAKIPPFIRGGSQERNMRGGTENIAGIVGLAKALELAYTHMDDHRKHIEQLKAAMILSLKASLPGIRFNGLSDQSGSSLHTILNVSLPPSDQNEMLLFNLDINGISASGGSACSSGTQIGSHVLAALGHDNDRGAIRFSFSRKNTLDEVNYVVEKLRELYSVGQ